MNLKFYVVFIATFVLSIITFKEAEASHAMGADISYECLDPDSNIYRIRLNLYRDCFGIAAPLQATISIGSASCGQNFTTTLIQLPAGNTTPGGTPHEVSQLCDSLVGQSTCNGGTYPGVELYQYEAIVTLPDTCNDWIISYSLCCRNELVTNLANPAAENLYVEATISNLDTCNSSPTFTNLPVTYICVNQPFNYNHGALDPEGDSLVYTLIDPLDGSGTPVVFAPGYSSLYPISTLSGSFSMDTLTGQLSFTPDSQQIGVLAFLVEQYTDLDGDGNHETFVGSVMRDMQIIVLDLPGCSNPGPGFGGIDSASLEGGVLVAPDEIEVCPGDTLIFSVSGTGLGSNTADSCVIITSNVDISIPDATFDTVRVSCDSMLGIFTWGTDAFDIGTHNLNIFVNVESCPIRNVQTFNLTIRVLDGTFAGPDLVYCPKGGPRQINAAGGSEFHWTPSGAGSGIVWANSDSSKIRVAPGVTTDYIVVSDLSSTCKNRDTVNVKVVPDFIEDVIASKDTICLYDSTYMNVIIDPSDLIWAPFIYNWTPDKSLSKDSISNPAASPFNTTNYEVSVTSDTGCTIRDTIRIVVSGVAPPFITFEGYPIICLGDSNRIEASTCNTIFEDDFDPTNPANWAVNDGVENMSCGSVFGNSLFFGNNLNREAQTVDMNTLGGGKVEFYLKYGTGAPCDPPEVGDVVRLQYSNNSGASWNTLQVFMNATGVYDTFKFVSIDIPLNVQTPATRFRWWQDVFAGTTDNWAIDEVVIRRGCCDTSCVYDYQWSPTAGLSDPTVKDPVFSTSSSTTYTVTVTVPGTDCYLIDSVDISVVPDFNYTLTVSKDTICLNDSVQLLITPDATGQPYTYNWSPTGVLTNPAISGPMGFPFESTYYQVSATSNLGCRNVDSIRVVVSGVSPAVLVFQGKPSICTGDTHQISVETCLNFFQDSFDPDVNFPIWANNTGIADPSCGFVSGPNALYFNAAAATGREARTIPLNLTAGGLIEFYIKTADGTVGACEDIDAVAEYPLLQFTTNGGASWTTLITFDPVLYSSFTYVSMPIPVAAQKPATQFRWWQSTFSGPANDHWALDDVSITLGCCGAGCGPYNYQWSPTTGISDPNIKNPLFFPVSTTTYTVTVTVPGTDCRKIDSIDVVVAPNFNYNLTISDDTICLFDSVSFLVTADPSQAPYMYQWNSGGELNDETISNPGAVPPHSFTYIVGITSDSGCFHEDSIRVTVGGVAPPFIKFEGYPVICSGDSNQISVVAGGGDLTDNFDLPNLNTDIWGSPTNGLLNGSDCGFVTPPNALYFNDAGSRNATTLPLDVSVGGDIEFWFIMGSGTAPCEQPDIAGTEDVVLEYSLTGAAGSYTVFWTATAGIGNFPNWTFIQVPIPAAAQTNNTFFRWRQLGHSGAAFDHWAIDDIQISIPLGPFDYQWSPTTGISDPNSDSPVFFPTSTTTYYVTVSALNPECRKVDSITIEVAPDFTYTVDVEDDTICENQSTYIHISPDASGAPYSYTWNPNSSVEGSDSSKSAHVRPMLTTDYHYTIVSDDGCRKIDSSLIVVDGKGPFVELSKDNNFICPGDTVTLTGVVSALHCGLNPNPLNPCPPNSQFATALMGTGTTTTTVETPFKGFWQDARIQIMYRASELKLNGLNSGTITDIVFNISSIASTVPYLGFTIKMGCTNKKSLSDFVNGLNTVYTNPSYTPTVGANTFTFDNPYDWDGQSNIIVEICYDNLPPFTNSDPVFGSFTNFNSVVWDQADLQVGCTLDGPTVSTFRPNTFFVMCTYQASGVALEWEPSTGLYDPLTGVPCDSCNPVNAVVYHDQTFTLNAFDGTCLGDSSVTVRIDSSLYIHAQKDTAICYSDSVPLEVLIFGDLPTTVISCGLESPPCMGNSNFQTVQVGNNNQQTDPGSFQYSVYSQWFSDAKTQILFTASELTAQGLLPGTFNELAFFVSNKGTSIAYDNFTIRVGCTTESSLSGFSTTPLSMVYGPISYSTVAGWNAHNLDPGFVWDGVDNIIVEICYDNPAFTFNEDIIEFTSTPAFNSVAWSGATSGIGCNLSSSSQVHKRRPNIQFTQCIANLAPVNLMWTPDSTLTSGTEDSIFAFPTKATNYIVRAAFSNGCVLYDTVKVNVGGFTYTKSPADPDTICPGDTAMLEVVGGDFIRWIESDSTLTDTSSHTPGAFPLGTRWYTFIASDSAGCRQRDSILVVVFNPGPLDIGNDTVLCSGQSVTLDAGPGWQSYEWMPNGETTQAITVTQPGTYYVIVTDVNCSFPSPPVTVSTPQPPVINSSVSFCQGDNATIVAPPGYVSYNWAITGDMTQSTVINSGGTYNVTVVDVNGCTMVSNNLTATALPVPDPNLGPDQSYCAGDGIDIGPPNTPGATYSWNTTATTRIISVTSPGTYSVTVDLNGCTNSDDIVVTENPLPSPNIGLDVDTCCGSVVNIQVSPANPGDSYLWNTGATTGSISVNTSDTYSVSVEDANGCINSDSKQVEIKCIIQGVTAIEDQIIQGQSSVLSVSTFYNGNFQYQWIPGDQLLNDSAQSVNSDSLLSTLTFTVEVTDLDNGCVESDTVTVEVIPSGFGVTPNAFSPNNDGLNEFFIPLVTGSVSINDFRVYNRWGDELYNYSEDPQKVGWDGTVNGIDQPVGSYVYYISVHRPDLENPGKFIDEIQQGVVTLIR